MLDDRLDRRKGFRQLHSWKNPRPEKKTVCVVRYGAFGDMLQMSSILPGLKRQGYHVTVMTTPAGQSVLLHDPHIDAWVLQDKDQVPDAELGDYFAAWSQKFDRWINLCEATEASAIAHPSRAAWHWPDDARRSYFGRLNYMRLLHSIAGVPARPTIRFYPTEEEQTWAKQQRQKFDGRPVVLWSLSGSSFHKAYPWTDAVVARLMRETEAAVVFTGDMACKILETGWEDEPRVLCASGEWSIRQALAFAQLADVVVGPETGVLNAVGFEPEVRSIVFLSHSSETNLCEGWRNYAALKPQGAACFPCHRMHLQRATCPQDEETGGALCASRIPPGAVFDAIGQGLKRRKAA